MQTIAAALLRPGRLSHVPLRADEVLLLNYGGESSDFVRFSKDLLARPAHGPKGLALDLIQGKHGAVSFDLAGTDEQPPQPPCAT